MPKEKNQNEESLAKEKRENAKKPKRKEPWRKELSWKKQKREKTERRKVEKERIEKERLEAERIAKEEAKTKAEAKKENNALMTSDKSPLVEKESATVEPVSVSHTGAVTETKENACCIIV